MLFRSVLQESVAAALFLERIEAELSGDRQAQFKVRKAPGAAPQASNAGHKGPTSPKAFHFNTRPANNNPSARVAISNHPGKSPEIRQNQTKLDSNAKLFHAFFAGDYFQCYFLCNITVEKDYIE